MDRGTINKRGASGYPDNKEKHVWNVSKLE